MGLCGACGCGGRFFLFIYMVVIMDRWIGRDRKGEGEGGDGIVGYSCGVSAVVMVTDCHSVDSSCVHSYM